MAFTAALYYPWIEVQDERWLATAAMYWETIQTIVPRGLTTPYRNAASQELADAGVLQPLLVHSDEDEIEDLATDVLTYLRTEEGSDLLFGRGRQGGTRMHGDKLPRVIRDFAHIHPEKLPREVRRELTMLSQEREGWLRVDRRFADFYMTLLANRLAERRAIGLLTASTLADRLSAKARAGAAGASAQSSRDMAASRPRELREGLVVDVVLEDLSVAPGTSLRKVLAFRRKYASELGHLRARLSELATTVPQEGTMRAARQQAHDIVINEVRPALDDLRAALRSSRLRTFTEGFLKVSLLSAAPTSGLMMLGSGGPVALAAGAAISVVATSAVYALEKEKTLRDNPFSYLLRVEREFGADG